jgi:hypothetical protein
MFLSGIFLVAFLGGDFDGSSEGDDLLVDRKFRNCFPGTTTWLGDLTLFPKKVVGPTPVGLIFSIA